MFTKLHLFSFVPDQGLFLRSDQRHDDQRERRIRQIESIRAEHCGIPVHQQRQGDDNQREVERVFNGRRSTDRCHGSQVQHKRKGRVFYIRF